jgi:HEAT repeat protein
VRLSPCRQDFPALIEALGDNDWRVRRSAAYALGRIGPAGVPAISALEQTLTDDDERVRSLAAKALQRIQPRSTP